MSSFLSYLLSVSCYQMHDTKKLVSKAICCEIKMWSCLVRMLTNDLRFSSEKALKKANVCNGLKSETRKLSDVFLKVTIAIVAIIFAQPSGPSILRCFSDNILGYYPVLEQAGAHFGKRPYFLHFAITAAPKWIFGLKLCDVHTRLLLHTQSY